MFKTIRMPFFSAETGGGDGDQQPVKTFTQEEVDRIIGDRLAREKSKVADYDDLKEVTETLKSFGYQGTVAEIKAELKQQAETRRKAEELKDLEEEAEKSGTSPEMLAEIKELKKELAEIKKDKQNQQKEQEDRKKADEVFQEQMKEFAVKHPTVDIDKLNENKKFIDFIENARPGQSLVQLYDKYIDLVGGAEKAAIEKMKSNDDRSTFSGKSKAEPSGGTFGLTEHQQKLAKENDMSFKAYADELAKVRK